MTPLPTLIIKMEILFAPATVASMACVSSVFLSVIETGFLTNQCKFFS